MTTVFVAGAHGQTGGRIVKELVKAGYDVRGLVRSTEHQRNVEAVGATGYLGDLSESFSDGLKGADVVICAVGAGANGDPEHVDHVGTVRLIEQCVLDKIPRFVLISSMGTMNPDDMPAFLKPFLIAKRKAEKVLEESGMVYTIIRPGGLTNEPASGNVMAAPHLAESGRISRDDVAAAVVLSLSMDETRNRSFDLVAGMEPLEKALTSLINTGKSGA
ncbi:putative sugar epimerase YhfK [Paenibacillus sp. J23TS9]|uniref:SDR family oxidoreductase n=1 Tax=Paenibacillus sp. J23TS9 TaxID=2807193 RepID=UPI001B262701|nr:SDR family oxidoreductase [Paenibacillus sp. J23TS9]GIP28796.1 putative sugar epimerase YhfK [Paenibacillus sp. J23TS9]